MNWNLQVARKDRMKSPKEVWEIPVLDGEIDKKPQETDEQKTQNYEEFQRMVNLYK